MNPDELLAQFRADVPRPDDATAERILRLVSSTRPRSVSPRRLVLAIAVTAAIGAAVAAVAFTDGSDRTGSLTSPPTTTTTTKSGRLTPFLPMTLDLTRTDGAVTSISMTAYARLSGATMKLQVWRSDTSQLSEVHSAGSQVVFEQDVQMTDLAAPTVNGALSSWSGTLTPNDWAGGCQDKLYWIRTVTVPIGARYDDEYRATAQDGWFVCTSS
jgi:hypothetical protein